MRRYTFKFSDDSIQEFDAEKDSLQKEPEIVILSKIKEQSGMILKAKDEPEIVACIPLYNLKFYTYVEI